MWLQKRTKQLKPVIRNVMNDPKMDPDLLFYFQNVDDVLDHCVEVGRVSVGIVGLGLALLLLLPRFFHCDFSCPLHKDKSLSEW